MHTQPRGHRPNGQLKMCDRCGFDYRWIELRNQFGKWICRPCQDRVDSSRNHTTTHIGSSGTGIVLPPDGLILTPVADREIDLTWTDGEDGGTIYIERSTSPSSGFVVITTVAAGVQAYANTGLTADTTYYYRIRAFVTGVGYSSYVSSSATTGSPP